LLPLLCAAAHAAGSFDFDGKQTENQFSEFDYLLRYGLEAQKHIGGLALQAVESFGLSNYYFKELVENGLPHGWDSPWPPDKQD
jgi:hypothetical protein